MRSQSFITRLRTAADGLSTDVAANFAVKYLRRPVKDHNYVKKLARPLLEARIPNLGMIVPKPWNHQLACVHLGLQNPGFLFFLDMGCVDAGTEYLTPYGWKRIADYDGELVAQYEPKTGEATFIQPLDYIKKPCTSFYHFKSARGLDQMLSPSHRMLVATTDIQKEYERGRVLFSKSIGKTPYNYGKGYNFFNETTPDRINNYLESGRTLRNAHIHCETTFQLKNNSRLDLTEAELRLQIAFHADGSFGRKNWRQFKAGKQGVMRLKRQHKITRLRTLLATAATLYRERFEEKTGFHIFSFVPPMHTKCFTQDWWHVSEAQKRIIVDEVGHWDGSFVKAGAIKFFTTIKDDADFIQFCFASTGRRASITRTERNRRGRLEIDYTVHAIGTGRTTNLVQYVSPPIKTPSPDGFMYCFNVPTTYLVLRRNNCIFITGNSGKSAIALNIIRERMRQGQIKRTLVLVPNVVNITSWAAEIIKHAPELRVVKMNDNSRIKRQTQLKEDADIWVLNYAGCSR